MARFKRGFCLAITLVLLFACTAAGAAFSMRNGITWDTTVSQMLEAEGRLDGGNINRGDYNGMTYFYLWNRDGVSEDVYYAFRGDQLLMAYFLLSGGAEAYASQADAQTAAYGTPADITADAVGALVSTLYPNTYLASVTAWQLSDGSLAVLFTADGQCYMAFINQPAL